MGIEENRIYQYYYNKGIDKGFTEEEAKEYAELLYEKRTLDY